MSTVLPDPTPARKPVGPSAPLSQLLAPVLLFLACWQGLRFASASHWWPSDADAAQTLWRLGATLTGIAGLWLLVRGVDLFIWERLLPRTHGVRVPRLLRQLLSVVLGLLAMALLLGQVWQVSVGPVMAATGAIGIVVGLALRNLLADFFSGIALNIEHPFRLDDFVLLHVRGRRDPVAGLVREINWRSTTVLTPEGNLISVPNAVVARSTVENLSFPSPVYELELDIVLDWHLDAALVERLLGAAMVDAWVRGATSGDKPPKCRISRLDGAGASWRIVYWIDPRKKPKGPARHQLLACVQQHLRFAGLRPVPAETSGVQWPAQVPLRPAVAEDRARIFGLVPLLQGLTAAERDALAAGATVVEAATEQAVVRAGDAGESMFVVAAGVLDVRRHDGGEPPGATGPRATTLSPGDWFGEMSLLTGAARSATVVALSPVVLLEIPRAQLAPLLAARASLAATLSAAVAEHQRHDAAAAAAGAVAPAVQTARLAASIADAMRRFFGA